MSGWIARPGRGRAGFFVTLTFVPPPPHLVYARIQGCVRTYTRLCTKTIRFGEQSNTSPFQGEMYKKEKKHFSANAWGLRNVFLFEITRAHVRATAAATRLLTNVNVWRKNRGATGGKSADRRLTRGADKCYLDTATGKSLTPRKGRSGSRARLRPDVAGGGRHSPPCPWKGARV